MGTADQNEESSARGGVRTGRSEILKSSHLQELSPMRVAEKASMPHLFTVAEYMKLDLSSRTELLGGVIYDVSPKNPPHSLAVSRLTKALNLGLRDDYRVNSQDPIAIEGWAGKHAPEIDVAVVTEKPYQTTPTAADSHVFIEVSDTTYRDDKTRKIPLLVAAGVPTWHVHIPARQVEFYDRGADLDAPRVFIEGETFDVLGVTIRVADLFDPKIEA
jgi:hypothetical protein